MPASSVATAMNRPVQPAMVSARLPSWVMPQMPARSARPPSSEDRHQRVRGRELERQVADHGAAGGQRHQGTGDDRDGEGDGRPGERDRGFGPGRRRLALHLGETPEEFQGDAAHPDPEPPRHHCVPEFVQQHRQQQADDDADAEAVGGDLGVTGAGVGAVADDDDDCEQDP
jgi:hypothetical protein